MKPIVAYTENIKRAKGMFERIQARSNTIPGMALVYGAPGTGKSKCLEWLKNDHETANSIFLRANRGFSPSTLLNKILLELDRETNRCNAVMLDTICQALTESKRPIFIDEADYLYHYPASLDFLRDIHDITQTPVMMFGMADGGSKDIHRRLSGFKQLNRRVSRRTAFRPCTWEDVQLIRDKCCEVNICDDALAEIYEETLGNHGLICNKLEEAEGFAKGQQWKSINATQRRAKLEREAAAA